jgi:hypothetical protein
MAAMRLSGKGLTFRGATPDKERIHIINNEREKYATV